MTLDDMIQVYSSGSTVVMHYKDPNKTNSDIISVVIWVGFNYF